MRVGKNGVTGEGEIYLDDQECEDMKEIVRCAPLPLKRKFHNTLKEL